MKAKYLIAVTAVAFAPFAAYADQGDKYLEQQLGTPSSTLTRAEVRAQATVPHLGQKHLVDLQTAERSTRTRAEVQSEALAGMIEHAGA